MKKKMPRISTVRGEVNTRMAVANSRPHRSTTLGESQMTHTPGPWKSEPHSAHEIAFLISSTAPQTMGGDRTVTVAKFASQADARLIAAAPQMLKVLKEVNSSLQALGSDAFGDASHLISITL